MIKLLVVKILKNIAAMAITEKFIMWALRVAVTKTSNKWDDSFVDILEAGRDSNAELLQKGIQGVVDKFNLKVKSSTKKSKTSK